jgi:hypothetical protein
MLVLVLLLALKLLCLAQGLAWKLKLESAQQLVLTKQSRRGLALCMRCNNL